MNSWGFSFGMALKKAREAKKLSQGELAVVLDASRATINRWEGGSADGARLRDLENACKYFRKPLSYFVPESESIPHDPSNAELAADLAEIKARLPAAAIPPDVLEMLSHVESEGQWRRIRAALRGLVTPSSSGESEASR